MLTVLICQNCKHWRKIRDTDYEDWKGPHGECRIIDETPTDQLAWLAGIEGIEHENLSLITHPWYGCNLWEFETVEGTLKISSKTIFRST